MFEDLKQPPLMRLSLNRAEDYDIFTALRGPDDGDDSIKHLTTCVIRWFVGMKKKRSTGGGLRGCLILSPEEASSGGVRHLKASWAIRSHFRSHIEKAFASLISKEVPGAKEYWFWLSQEWGTPGG